jgi:hypothetical protein
VLSSDFLGHAHQTHADELKAFFLETSDDAAGQTPVKGVRLEEEKCSFHV